MSITAENSARPAEKALLAAFLLLYAAVFTAKLPARIASGETAIIIQVIAYIGFGISGAFLFRREFVAGIIDWKSSAIKNLLWVMGAFVAELLLTSIAAYPAYAAGYEDANAPAILLAVRTVGKPLAVFAIGITGSAAEEFVYRAFLVGRAGAFFGRVTAGATGTKEAGTAQGLGVRRFVKKGSAPVITCVVLSSALFAITHLHGISNVEILGILPIFVAGLIYGTVYAATGNITLPLAMHIANNTLGLALGPV
jgi:membrane protease YdiL (CAAX protease family)